MPCEGSDVVEKMLQLNPLCTGATSVITLFFFLLHVMSNKPRKLPLLILVTSWQMRTKKFLFVF